jgi:integrase
MHNPCDTTKLPRSITPQRRYLTLPEVHDLTNTIDPRYKTFTQTGFLTGLRPHELVALKTTDLNLKDRTLTVTHTATELNGTIAHQPEGKTSNARRTITLDTGLVTALTEHIETNQLHTALRWEDAPFLFTAPSGGPINRRNFRRRFWKPAVQASVGEPMRMHDMRHTHVALILKTSPTKSLKSVSDRLGHGDIMITMNTYGHLFAGYDEDIADSLGDAFWQDDATSAV